MHVPKSNESIPQDCKRVTIPLSPRLWLYSPNASNPGWFASRMRQHRPRRQHSYRLTSTNAYQVHVRYHIQYMMVQHKSPPSANACTVSFQIQSLLSSTLSCRMHKLMVDYVVCSEHASTKKQSSSYGVFHNFYHGTSGKELFFALLLYRYRYRYVIQKIWAKYRQNVGLFFFRSRLLCSLIYYAMHPKIKR